ncbi:MAG: T9SS type A sorting domain-containing protein, partial [Flavobacteriales bacterium]
DGPYTYWWSTDETTACIDVTVAGTYTVTITDANGCSSTCFLTVVISPAPCECELRTQTMHNWGASPQGSNAGTYLHANFADAFPAGLEVGCTRLLQLTSAQAVTDFLPAIGQPSMLPPGILTDPTAYNNNLAGQLVAATLNVGFDAHDPAFSGSSTLLGDAYIASGLFAGMRVSDVVYLANQYTGACGGTYSASQLRTALASINTSNINGSTATGFLTCAPPAENSRMIADYDPEDALIAFPNPVRDDLTVRTLFGSDGRVTIDLLDLSGRNVIAVDRFSAEAGALHENHLSTTRLEGGSYLLVVEREGQRMTQRIVVTH